MKDTRRTRIVLAVLVLTALTLITIDARGGTTGPLGAVRQGVQSVLGPVQSALAAVVDPVARYLRGLTTDEQARLDRLEKENAELRQQLRTSEQARARAAELDALLRVAGAGQYRTVVAQVVAVGPRQDFALTATIDAGTQDGIARDMSVINGDGLVGRVISVTGSTAVVLLVVDPQSAVGARLEGSRQLAIVNGRGARLPLEMQVLDPQAPLRPDVRVVTLGSPGGRPYVPGVPIGTVTAVQGTPGSLVRVAKVAPFIDPFSLDIVGVVVEPPRTDPRDAVLPPRPAAQQPSARPTPARPATPTPRSSASPSPG